ncbi:MAG: Ku protein [Candidatus Limnocylindria bacterium]
MRPIWKGAISFGMVTIPVKLYTATEDKDVRFRLLHRKDHAPILEKRFCTAEDREVAWDDLVRGFEVRKGEFVVVDPKEIDEVKPESANTIDIGDFVELDEIDPIYFEKSYFLEPAGVGAKPFSLLKRALDETGRIAVARVTIRSKERLATIRAYDGTLVLETMYFPDEIRSTSALDLPDASESLLSSKELKMARALVENLSDKFKPEEYQDRYRIALQELIERKMAGEKRNAKRRKPEPKIIDLMAALEASVAASRARGGGKAADSKASRTSRTSRTSRSTRRSAA